MKILFVCRGNVGRSQIAEAIFRHLIHAKFSVQSAGVEALGDDGTNLDGMLLKNRYSSKHVIESLKEIDIDVSNNVIKRIAQKMVKDADKIIVMIKPDAIPEYLKTNTRVIFWDIKDPDGQTLEYHRKTRDEIKKLVEQLVHDILGHN